jgi:hypothetical protein
VGQKSPERGLDTIVRRQRKIEVAFGAIKVATSIKAAVFHRLLWINYGIEKQKGGAVVKRSLFWASLVLIAGGFLASSGVADDTLVSFKGGIGVIPVSSGAGTLATATTVNRNIVRGVQPPGQIWRIDDLDAKVKTDGSITVDGRGLLLAGGNNIGTNAGQSVRAKLLCGTVQHDSGLVPLAENGDFRIVDVLSPLPPNPCNSPVLLIVSSNGSWFAAGIPKSDKGND